MIKLRPHHLLCTQGYSGKGYSREFVENMTEIVKSIKNEIELKNIRNSHIKDGVAFTKFMYWLKI